ncbi:PQQ-dependent sugar dehydrogenase [Stieleria sp. TO1_6]|uniref:PQQ-dependent sugar dehydrogenase n=1 Tax=Stieleria tagensis TaxID=2956795 RepID=UPI00209B686E|nr:PQQ-dependent sugar dehydrogenase [Stieleria tagensis]MCO8124033.1 PQQ-dependent sugar dehydrogenase [Stieleria tagensis]
MFTGIAWFRCLIVIASMLLIRVLAGMPQDGLAQSPTRVQWTESQIHGTPDPPNPYTTTQVFADVPLFEPTEMIRVPNTDRWLVADNKGQIVSFSKQADRDIQDAIDLKALPMPGRQVFGMTFHPDYPRQPWCYISYVVSTDTPDGTRLSRFKVIDTERMVLDPASEQVIISWIGGGHSGGSLHFGADNYLYISIGDGDRPNPPDFKDTGQDISDLAASVLRIDVNQSADGLAYRIPDDNPFVDLPGARGEVWAFGFRNPWKMAFDPKTDTLWTGDVGWEMMEMIYRVDRGANYGWSLMEGSQVVKENGKLGPAPITPPMAEHSHLEARSITGGYFWNSPRLPELVDAYIYGDWITGKIWGLKHDGEKVIWKRELADTSMRIICFALDTDGEVLVVGFDGSIHRLQPNDAAAAEADFPRRLSETGLFASTAEQIAAPGVLPYAINAHHWADHTQSQQWVAIPGQAQVGIFDKPDWRTGQVLGHFSFPQDAVLAKTVFYQPDPSKPQDKVRLETQVLHRNGDDWNAYNYIWNDDQTDAVLQDNVASDRPIEILDPDQPAGIRKQIWHHSSRDECLQCHFWNAGTVHGFKLNQLNRDDPFSSGNQLQRFAQSGILEPGLLQNKAADTDPIASPYDETVSLQDRARSYLHMNCAHCHRFGGGGTAAFELIGSLPLEKMGVVDALPTQGTFALPDARVIAPGDPCRSVLFYRLIKSGRGRMPQFGPSLIDDQGAALIHDWITSLDPTSDEPAADQPVADLLQDARPADSQWQQQIQQQIKSTSDALRLAHACADQSVPYQTRLAVAEIAAQHSDSMIRDLFERFLPPERRVKRLGNNVNADALLAMQGDAQAGAAIYFQSANVSCRQCHRIGDQGQTVGPDLSSIGVQRTPAEILASLLQPSQTIDDKYRGKLILTIDGRILSGLVTAETDDSIKIVDPTGKQHVVAMDDVESIKPMDKSVMPDRLLAEFTAQQAADLLAFLVTQQRPLVDATAAPQ